MMLGCGARVYGAPGAVLVLLLWHSLHAGPTCFPRAVPEVGSSQHALCVSRSLSGARMLSSGAMECSIHLFGVEWGLCPALVGQQE